MPYRGFSSTFIVLSTRSIFVTCLFNVLFFYYSLSIICYLKLASKIYVDIDREPAIFECSRPGLRNSFSSPVYTEFLMIMLIDFSFYFMFYYCNPLSYKFIPFLLILTLCLLIFCFYCLAFALNVNQKHKWICSSIFSFLLLDFRLFFLALSLVKGLAYLS